MPNWLYALHIGVDIGVSVVYNDFVQMLQKYKHYQSMQQSEKEKTICNHILHAWKLCKTEIHFIACMLDIRFTRRNLFMPGDDVDGFLELVRSRLDNDDQCNAFVVECTKWRNHAAPYTTGIIILFYTNASCLFHHMHALLRSKKLLRDKVILMEDSCIQIQMIEIGCLIKIIGQQFICDIMITKEENY